MESLVPTKPKELLIIQEIVVTRTPGGAELLQNYINSKIAELNLHTEEVLSTPETTAYLEAVEYLDKNVRPELEKEVMIKFSNPEKEWVKEAKLVENAKEVTEAFIEGMIMEMRQQLKANSSAFRDHVIPQQDIYMELAKISDIANKIGLEVKNLPTPGLAFQDIKAVPEYDYQFSPDISTLEDASIEFFKIFYEELSKYNENLNNEIHLEDSNYLELLLKVLAGLGYDEKHIEQIRNGHEKFPTFDILANLPSIKETRIVFGKEEENFIKFYARSKKHEVALWRKKDNSPRYSPVSIFANSKAFVYKYIIPLTERLVEKFPLIKGTTKMGSFYVNYGYFSKVSRAYMDIIKPQKNIGKKVTTMIKIGEFCFPGIKFLDVDEIDEE